MVSLDQAKGSGLIKKLKKIDIEKEKREAIPMEKATEYPCVFDLKLLRWERYASEKNRNSDIRTVTLGEPYTLWVEYCMALWVGTRVLHQSEKDTTLIVEDIKRLIEDLRRLAHGEKDRIVFHPIEPDFELSICKITESNASVIVSSISKMRAKISAGATDLSSLFKMGTLSHEPCF